jgi:ectoine hydroxylase-related dioxygenase (phytanoyl-CoA dioxygenase family)
METDTTMSQSEAQLDPPADLDPIVSSSDLLGDPERLRRRFQEDGYLYLPELVPRPRLQALQAEIFAICRERGWFAPESTSIERDEPRIVPVNEGEPEFFEVYDAVQRLESFHSLAHDDAILGVMRVILDETAFPHPLSICRLMFPDNNEAATPPHQDYPNNQGTTELYTCWMPLTDCPIELGGLSLLPGSHRHGLLPLAFALGPGKRTAVVPDELVDRRWVGGSYRVGDALIFHSLLLHRSLHNRTKRMRLSVDYRYQSVQGALTEQVLHPHYRRFTWDEIYQGWQSDRHQYYWRSLPLQFAPWKAEYHALPEDHLAEAIRLENEYNRRRAAKKEQ